MPKVNTELMKPKFANEVKVDPLLGTIMDIFREYQEAQKEKWISLEHELLKDLKQACQAWIDTNKGSQGKEQKLKDVLGMWLLADNSLRDQKFADQVKSDKQLEKIKAYEYKVSKHDRDMLYQTRHEKNSWMTEMVPEEQEKKKERQRKKVADLKKLTLTKAERVAIASYTDENYSLINPAISGDKKWLEESISARNEVHKRVGIKLLDTSPQGMEQAVAENKKIAKLTQAGLDKLPNWKQDHPLYRGDTFSMEEGQKLIAGNKKTYPHFVSTSQGIELPRKVRAQ